MKEVYCDWVRHSKIGEALGKSSRNEIDQEVKVNTENLTSVVTIFDINGKAVSTTKFYRQNINSVQELINDNNLITSGFYMYVVESETDVKSGYMFKY